MIIVGYRNTPKLFGCVDNFECPKCLNKSNWKLLNLEKYFTLFFIPIIPMGNEYSLICQHCDYQEFLSKKDFINYKLKSEIEQSCSEREITENDKEIKLKTINALIEQAKESRRNKALEGSKEWTDLASKKTDDELMTIYFKERYKYNPSMLIAVKAEIDRRKLA
jgi:DNA-directed RNA polymerase subunit M/transcription elongation factor TFIIS